MGGENGIAISDLQVSVDIADKDFFLFFLHSTLDKSQSECILTASLVSYVGEIGRQDHGSSDRTELCVCDLSAFEHENSPVERDPDHFAA